MRISSEAEILTVFTGAADDLSDLVAMAETEASADIIFIVRKTA